MVNRSPGIVMPVLTVTEVIQHRKKKAADTGWKQETYSRNTRLQMEQDKDGYCIYSNFK